MYTESDVVRIAKRENNNRRKYLVVNRLQGKHIPVRPKEAFAMFDALAEIIKKAYSGERLLLIGFAETATAIGARLAVDLGAAYIQTTREQIEGVSYLYFTESHSHAAEQKLVKDDIDAAIEQADRIIFVEDEVTTGNTILKIVTILEEVYQKEVPFAAASLLNGMDDISLQDYKKRNIAVHYLIKTNHSQYTKIAERYKGDGTYIKANTDEAAIHVPIKILSAYQNSRRLINGKSYNAACEKLWMQIKNDIDLDKKSSVLVLGSEEFMYPVLYVADKIEETGCSVKCHSTTRSPIAAGTEKEPDYPLHTRYELASLYDKNRKIFIYDLISYDLVVVLTDAPLEKKAGFYTLVNALMAAGNQNIMFFGWCES